MNKQDEELKGYKRSAYEEREDIAGEHKISDLGQLFFLITFLFIWGFDSFYFRFSTFLADYVYMYIRAPIAVVLFLVAGFFAYKGLKQVFKEVRDPPEIIKTGVFAYSRHPIYLGSILVYVGWILLTMSLISLGFWVIIVMFYEYIATYEEKLLLKQFGKEYEDYKKEVPKWIPGTKFRKN